MAAALRCAPPCTNSASGSVSLHSAFETQARSSAATAREVLFAGTRLIGRTAGPVPDTELSLRPGRPQGLRPLRPAQCDGNGRYVAPGSRNVKSSKQKVTSRSQTHHDWAHRQTATPEQAA